MFRIIKWLIALPLGAFIFFNAYVYGNIITYRAVAPNKTAFMAMRMRQFQSEGKDVALDYRWVPYDRISVNLKKALIAALLLSGCASTANYEASLQQWVGQPLDDLVLAWGPPQSSYTLRDGRQVVEYLRQRIINTPGFTWHHPHTIYQEGQTYNADGSPSGEYRGSSTIFLAEETPGDSHYLECRTRFIVSQQGDIQQWKWEGNDCRK